VSTTIGTAPAASAPPLLDHRLDADAVLAEDRGEVAEHAGAVEAVKRR
jgi:hypothetical protein